MKIDPLSSPQTSDTRRAGAAAILAAATAATAAVLWSLQVVGPLGPGLIFFIIVAWFSVPGLVAAWLMYAPAPGRGFATWTVGPIWGYGISSVALLVLWIAGFRGLFLLVDL